MRLSNVRLLVTRFAKVFDFYRDVMAFPVVFGDEKGPYAEFKAGEEGLVAIFDRVVWSQALGEDLVPYDLRRFDRTVLILDVQDVDASLAELKLKGARVAHEPADRPEWGIRTAHIRDPDGQLIELAAPLRE